MSHAADSDPQPIEANDFAEAILAHVREELETFRTEVEDRRGLDLTEIQLERLARKLANLSPGLAQSATNTPVPFSGGTP